MFLYFWFLLMCFAQKEFGFSDFVSLVLHPATNSFFNTSISFFSTSTFDYNDVFQLFRCCKGITSAFRLIVSLEITLYRLIHYCFLCFFKHIILADFSGLTHMSKCVGQIKFLLKMGFGFKLHVFHMKPLCHIL